MYSWVSSILLIVLIVDIDNNRGRVSMSHTAANLCQSITSYLFEKILTRRSQYSNGAGAGAGSGAVLDFLLGEHILSLCWL